MKKPFASAAVLACTTLACSCTWAQTTEKNNFIGPAVGVPVTTGRYVIDRDPAWTSELSSTATTVDLIGSWGFAISPTWVATIGAKIGLTQPEVFTTTTSSSTSNATSKQRFAFTVAPGYRISSSGLLYGKLGYHSTTNNYASNLGTDYSLTHTGFGAGFGYAHAITKNIEFRGEFESINYSYADGLNGIKLAPKTNAVNLMALYKF